MQNQKPGVKGKVRRQTSHQLWSIVTWTAAALWPTIEENILPVPHIKKFEHGIAKSESIHKVWFTILVY